ncbi:4Fe-4S binding protein [Desulfosporosinus sp. PR]|uniref:4Fe-4S binding protein n=1 Tax=Candidatus Desulfosporosinus nitrosoreducens TaxID=3401928 RepID=UPI0027EA0DB8|nr:4Fe-4S binding protein [Desulfosporosinus sp. PR]MDQ7096798.1 4Fe-4S binding protein [Desulfosporosinus sp. PR]
MTCQMVYHNGNCLNTKKPYANSCRLCLDICPYQAISDYHQIDVRKCSECGACMAVCPSDGFVDVMIDKFQDYLAETEEILLNCPQAVPSGFEIPCLGMFDRDSWTSLMLWAKKKPVTIVTGVCADCGDRAACAASVQAFKQVHSSWPGHGEVRIQVRPDAGLAAESKTANPQVPKPAVQGSGNWRQKGLKKVEEWLPNLTADQAYSLPKSRQGLMNVLEKYPEEKVPFPALVVTDLCTNCGVCAAICPQDALQKTEEWDSDPKAKESAQEDRISSLQLILEPQKCVHCNRCVEVCRIQALSMETKMLSRRFLAGKVLIHEGSPLYCKQCGKRIFDNSELCLVCSTSDPQGRSSFFL